MKYRTLKFLEFRKSFVYLISDYDSLCKERGYPGYAVYYKQRSDRAEEMDVADLNLFVQLLEIDSKLGPVNEDQLAGLLICPFPNLEMINVIFLTFALFLLEFKVIPAPNHPPENISGYAPYYLGKNHDEKNYKTNLYSDNHISIFRIIFMLRGP